jgi:hypothetical protein
MWWTTNTGAGKLSGICAANFVRASIPPEETPTTTAAEPPVLDFLNLALAISSSGVRIVFAL